jgi:chromate transporter
MQTELVEKKKWISQSRFLHALNFCMLLPGPEAMQLATYIGWLLHRTWGGIVAGAFFVIPSIFVLWGLSFVYAAYGNIPWIAAVFYGLKPAVMAIVAVAVIRIGRKALKNSVMWVLAALAFGAIFFLKVPFPIIVIAAAITGFIGGKLWRDKFGVVSGHGPAEFADKSVLGDEMESPEHTRPSLSRAIKVTITCLALWLVPSLAPWVMARLEQRVIQRRCFFQQSRGGHLWRRLCRASIRCAAGS